MNTLSGGALDWIRELGFEMKDLIPYQYPSPDEFDKHDLQIVYLGWFLGDWSLVNNGMYACSAGLTIREDIVANTGDLYGITSLDEDWVTLNQMIKYYKYGFGRVSDYINEDIRSNYIKREEAISIVEKYDHCCSDNYIKNFCRYINISQEDFWFNIRKNVNKNLFHIDNKLNIKKKFKVGKGL
jgi:hypothetical protein